MLLESSLCAEEAVSVTEVENTTIRRLCKNRVITTVNGRLPGPPIYAYDGDTVIIHVLNKSPYRITIHCAWADGPNYITQCPILPGGSYTYKFNITGQEGTLWWHAHVSFLRATVYGALIIKPREGSKAYPFIKPYKEIPLLLGEWWNANVVDVANEALASGGAPNNSDAFTINGSPSDLYRCSNKHTYKVEVEQGKTYMLRIINAALNNQLFFKVASHTFTVVAVDASYTVPYFTDVIIIPPGQTVDALMVADANPGFYNMAAQAYISTTNVTFDNTTTTGIIKYKSTTQMAATTPIMPTLPSFSDTPTAHRFYTSLTGLLKPGLPTVPLSIDGDYGRFCKAEEVDVQRRRTLSPLQWTQQASS